MEWFVASLPGIITGLMLTGFGWLAGKVGEARRNRKEESAQIAQLAEEIQKLRDEQEAERPKRQALYKGMKAELRESLVDAYDKYVLDQKPLTVERFHEITEGYEAYAELGGNGTGKTMYEGIREVPIEIMK